ncbi:MAG: hypothetical protein KY449_00955 [Proteobacteria bacterium]|nr:hypothetical protein [Pseudomonadota bacterium]
MGKYDPLTGELRRARAAEVILSFRQIERVIGAMLPNRARRPEWWANETDQRAGSVQSRAWLDAGFRAYLIPGSEQVRFQKTV